MNSAYPADIAARAANLAERAEIVAALGPPPVPLPLAAFESWQLDRLVIRLAARFGQQAARGQGTARHTDRSLWEILTDYRAHEQDLGDAGGPFGRALARLHRDWLPAYQAALDGFDPTAAADARWREPDVYYGRLAKACEPFLLELGRRIQGAGDHGALRVDPRVIEDFQAHLLERFDLALAGAVEADAKARCARPGMDAAAGEPGYLRYLDEAFADAESYHRFYLAFPVLGRWLAQVTAMLAEHGRELIARLAADAGDIGAAFFTEPVVAVRSVRLGRSDPHAGARGVAITEVELASGAIAAVVYKPRCVKAEAALQGLLGRLRADGVLNFAPYGVLPRPGYGYEKAIPAARNRVDSTGQAWPVYAELGGYLAISYILGGGDLHLENVLVADGHAFICDGESVLGALAEGAVRPPGTIMDSVFQTGLIEWPSAAGGEPAMKFSGYSGGGTGNRVFIGDRLTQPEEFTDAIRFGFDRVYQWFQRSPERATDCVRGLFSGSSVRFINWSTQIYAQLLQAARHPACLMEPLEVDLLFSAIWMSPRHWDHHGVVPERELASLWGQDVPLFSVAADDSRLVHDHAVQVLAKLPKAPLDLAAQRIAGLSSANRARQHQYIAAALSGGEVTSPESSRACLEQAAGIGRHLCALLREPGAPAPWTGIEADLYGGSAGVALFLAYLNDLEPRAEFASAARRAAGHALAAWDRRRIGAFTGAGGLIYLLTHLHHLWGDRALLDHAVRLADSLPVQIEDDRHLDIFHGVAGLIPVLLGLAGAAGGRGLDQAHECAVHLLRQAEAAGETLSWPGPEAGPTTPNLTGFAHGAGGIGWALIALGASTGRSPYVLAGLHAFAYEASHFDQRERDWYDLRVTPAGRASGRRHYSNAWCSGAAGIGLGRIDAWALLDKKDDDILEDAHHALSATLRSFPRLGNDSLCHGRSGNAELLLRLAALEGQPAYRLEAGVQARSSCGDLDHAGPPGQPERIPGLMLGMAGRGMHLLRLARPESIPLVLLLDPPPTAHPA
jgi:lantibiotic modifying enzyme